MDELVPKQKFSPRRCFNPWISKCHTNVTNGCNIFCSYLGTYVQEMIKNSQFRKAKKQRHTQYQYQSHFWPRDSSAVAQFLSAVAFLHLKGDVDSVAPLLVHELRLLWGTAQFLHNLGVVTVVWKEDGAVKVFLASYLTHANVLVMEEFPKPFNSFCSSQNKLPKNRLSSPPFTLQM